MKKYYVIIFLAVICQLCDAQGGNDLEGFHRTGRNAVIEYDGMSFQVNQKIVTVKPKTKFSKLEKNVVIRKNLLGYYDLAVPEEMCVEDFVIMSLGRWS